MCEYSGGGGGGGLVLPDDTAPVRDFLVLSLTQEQRCGRSSSQGRVMTRGHGALPSSMCVHVHACVLPCLCLRSVATSAVSAYMFLFFLHGWEDVHYARLFWSPPPQSLSISPSPPMGAVVNQVGNGWVFEPTMPP